MTGVYGSVHQVPGVAEEESTIYREEVKEGKSVDMGKGSTPWYGQEWTVCFVLVLDVNVYLSAYRIFNMKTMLHAPPQS